VASFFQGKSYVFILTKNGFGNILGAFFTNSTGHRWPDPETITIGDSS
jgi:hypothetical protein